MIDMSQIANKLKELGYEVNTEWYKKVELWEKWYKGYDPDFHKYQQVAPDSTVNDIELSSLKMGKSVCEDWASLLLSEQTTVTLEHEGSLKFIQGDDEMMQGGVFGETDFWVKANELVEKAFATGLGAFIPKIVDAQVTGEGRLTSGRVGMDFVAAKNIIPLRWANGIITECAFVSERKERDGYVMVLQVHKPGQIDFQWYRSTEKGLVSTPITEGYIQTLSFGTEHKDLFLPVFIKPQISNFYDPVSPFGVSVLSQAIDVLKGVDLAYDNLNSDLELGRKMVILRDEMFQKNSEGKKVAPQKTRRRLFQALPEGIPSPDKDTFYKEYNPELRIEENTQAVQAQLNYLSFKCGLGQKYYTFNQGSVATATQIISENGALFRNRQKHNLCIQKALVNVVQNLLKLGQVLGEDVDPQTKVAVVMDDSIITDTNAEKMQFIAEINAGVRQKWEYRVKFFGESEEDAKARAVADTSSSDPFGFGSGGGNA